MKPIRYLLCQLELEGIRIAADGLIGRVSPRVADFPLMIVARTCDGQRLVCVDDQLPAYVRTVLLESKPQLTRIEMALRILEASGILATENEYKTYVFPEHLAYETTEPVRCLHPEDPKVIAFGMGRLRGPVFAIENGEAILSACVSSRQNHRCAEAWVMTHPEHRRKGYGRKVVAAWAVALQAQGILPFYSHDTQNVESALLAESLELREVFTETVIGRAVRAGPVP